MKRVVLLPIAFLLLFFSLGAAGVAAQGIVDKASVMSPLDKAQVAFVGELLKKRDVDFRVVTSKSFEEASQVAKGRGFGEDVILLLYTPSGMDLWSGAKFTAKMNGRLKDLRMLSSIAGRGNAPGLSGQNVLAAARAVGMYLDPQFRPDYLSYQVAFAGVLFKLSPWVVKSWAGIAAIIALVILYPFVKRMTLYEEETGDAGASKVEGGDSGD